VYRLLVIAFVCILAVSHPWGRIAAQGTSQVPRTPTTNDRVAAVDEASRDERVPVLCRRLAAGIRSLALEPDQEGKYIFLIASGAEYDMLERQRYYYYKKARVYVNQQKVTKIIFEYYRFSLINMVSDTKTFTVTDPENQDLSGLDILYASNTGETRRYRVGDLKKEDSRRSVVKQYVSYLITLVIKLELHKNKKIDVETVGIERTIQLGD